jgi:preprotein translocase subunit Sss1
MSLALNQALEKPTHNRYIPTHVLSKIPGLVKSGVGELGYIVSMIGSGINEGY